MNKILFLIVLGPIFCIQAKDVVHTKWRLKDSLLKIAKTQKVTGKHQIKFGYASKSLTNLKVKSSSNSFSFENQNVPGVQIGHDRTFELFGTQSCVYTTVSYFTHYNNLGIQGFADLSVFDLYTGLSIGYSFFKRYKVKPSLIGGIGHSYYFQRGDAQALNADQNLFEFEYGTNLDFTIPRQDPYPESWSSDYIVSLRYSLLSPLTDSDSLSKGQKISVLFGVQL